MKSFDTETGDDKKRKEKSERELIITINFFSFFFQVQSLRECLMGCVETTRTASPFFLLPPHIRMGGEGWQRVSDERERERPSCVLINFSPPTVL